MPRRILACQIGWHSIEAHVQEDAPSYMKNRLRRVGQALAVPSLLMYWCSSASRATSFTTEEKGFLCKVFCQSGTSRILSLRSLCICTFPKSVRFDPPVRCLPPPVRCLPPLSAAYIPCMWLDDRTLPHIQSSTHSKGLDCTLQRHSTEAPRAILAPKLGLCHRLHGSLSLA